MASTARLTGSIAVSTASELLINTSVLRTALGLAANDPCAIGIPDGLAKYDQFTFCCQDGTWSLYGGVDDQADPTLTLIESGLGAFEHVNVGALGGSTSTGRVLGPMRCSAYKITWSAPVTSTVYVVAWSSKEMASR